MDLKTSNDVLDNWEQFKKKEGKKRLLDGIPDSLPALMRAEKIQEKATRVGFDWPDITGAVDKFKEEVDELIQAEGAQMTEEMGDVFFSLVNIARMKNIEPEQALQGCNDKFRRRFNYIEEQIKAANKSFADINLQEMDEMWNEAKTRGL
jgi:tetrapyrrole methylase family protein/MazG family protein